MQENKPKEQLMNPTFGDKVEEAHYQTRYGVYAVIPNQDKTKIILCRLLMKLGFSQAEKSKQVRITLVP